MIAEDNPFPPEALDTNRSGRMTDRQLSEARAKSRGVRRGELGFAAFFLALGALFAYASIHGHADRTSAVVGIGGLAVGTALVVRSVTGADALTRDLRRPQVQEVEGAILKEAHHVSSSNGGGSYTHYTLTVAGQRCEVDERTYDAAPEMGYVRLYFLPRSHHVVNLERLPDRPVPQGATVPGLTERALKAWIKGDSVTEAESVASLGALAHAMQTEFSPPAAPPPLEERDPRPLDEAIVGTWTNSLMKFSFLPDGTITTALPGGHHKTGRWSVDGNSTLHADLLGHRAEGDAWVTGDHLTISFEKGKAMVLRRESG